MSVAPDQLTAIYQKLQDLFKSHPVISILPTKGEPPDQYEVTYNIKGLCKDSDDAVAQTSNHTIDISIPFGFPNFPPSCKPKTEIFHPDFDPAAICLGDFWHQDCSLEDLVIHLGRMINGEIYSTQNAFNEEAAEYYVSHQDIFPLSQIAWDDGNLGFIPANSSVSRVDTLEEEDLLPDFNFFALEKEESESEAVGKGFGEQTARSDNIHDQLFLLEGQKKFYQLLDVATHCSLPAEELDLFVQNGRFQIAKAEELYRAAQLKETQGLGEEALRLYADVGNTVSDFPSINSDIQRVTHSFLTEKAAIHDSSGVEQVISVGNSITGDTPHQRTHSEKSPPSFFSESPKKSRLPLYLALLFLLFITGFAAIIWRASSRNLILAEESFTQCSSSLEKNHFSEAKSQCEQALRSAEKVNFLDKERIWQIQAGASELLKSEKLIQGLAGKIYLDGRYLPSREAKLLMKLNQQLLDADAYYLAEKWQKAAQLFGILELQAKKSGLFEESTLKEIANKRLTAEFRVTYDSAQVAMALVAMQQGQWEVAVAELIKAQDILTKIPEPERSHYSEQLQYALEKCRFEDFKLQGDRYYAAGEWRSAQTSYKFALTNAENDSFLPSDSKAEVRRSMTRAELYVAIDEGNLAFGAKKWDDAIAAYDRAIKLLTDHWDVFDPADSELNRIKLNRIALQAVIIRDRQKAKRAIKEKDLLEAKNLYQQTLANIDTSRFAQENEFSSTRKEIDTALKGLNEEINLAQKEDYLLQNYQSFFATNYPATIPENLKNPIIKLTRETPDTYIFKMQCTETGRRRPLTLVMYYAYNKKNGRWSLFNENQ